MAFQNGSHAVFIIQYHFAFVIKYRYQAGQMGLKQTVLAYLMRNYTQKQQNLKIKVVDAH